MEKDPDNYRDKNGEQRFLKIGMITNKEKKVLNKRELIPKLRKTLF